MDRFDPMIFLGGNFIVLYIIFTRIVDHTECGRNKVKISHLQYFSSAREVQGRC